MMRELYTVGHSNRTETEFLAVLGRHRIAAVADVRSVPFSRFTPQFNQDLLREALGRRGIAYLDFCDALGARRIETECYINGAVDFDKTRRSPLFVAGIGRLLDAARNERVALMCAERDPTQCHRMILLCPPLIRAGAEVRHILDSDLVESHEEAERRLLDVLGVDRCDLFRSEQEILEDAYREQAKKIAFRDAGNREVIAEAAL